MTHVHDHRLNDQLLMVCDDEGRFVGRYVRRDLAHTGDGHRHLAIAVLLYNRAGAVLLQRRKHRLFDDVWDITGATHPLRLTDGTHESLERATRRCLRHEYGIDGPPLIEVGSFTYFARDGDGAHCENEHCTLFIGELNAPVALNPDVGYCYRWVSMPSLLRDVEASPERYAPWALLSVSLLLRTGFLKQSPDPRTPSRMG
jgi:isopentenyl-diphosphate delta-isomerase